MLQPRTPGKCLYDCLGISCLEIWKLERWRRRQDLTGAVKCAYLLPYLIYGKIIYGK
jgi:hypothetical protein